MGLKDTTKLISKIAKENLINKPYLVGGLPRELYMGVDEIKTNDLDITTNSKDALRLGILFADHINESFEVSDDGHITVFADRFDVDFSSNFVSESVLKYLNGRYKGFEEAFSRDFTINTLYQDMETGELVDPTEQGFQDIKDMLIRTPVPASITLTDDPRRAYRAVNLASRYGFEVDKEIKDFVLTNPDIFSFKNIKDKYIKQKINKGIQENPELTIRLLKELGLFKNVPLSGKFKDLLLEKKILIDYLNNSVLDKSAQLASDWEEYSLQGPEYRMIEQWWKGNYTKFHGSNSSYQSWSKWYMDKYRNEWGGHKGPEEVLSIMKGDIDQKDNKIFISLKENGGKVKVKHGVDVNNVSQNVKKFIDVLGQVAKNLNADTPVITSGYRSPEMQARVMLQNWKRNGGRRYLEGLYGKGYGGKMSDIFETYRGRRDRINNALPIVNQYGGAHVRRPAEAIDLRPTSGLKQVLDMIVSSNMFNLKIVDETNSKAPHYHVAIYSISSGSV